MHFLKLRIAGIDIPFEEIIHAVGKRWKIKCRKGKSHQYDMNQMQNNEDSIIFEREIDSQSSINDELADFVDQLYNLKDYLVELKFAFSIKLWISIYPETEQLYFGLTSSVIRKIADLGIDIDVSILCLQEFYRGTYTEAFGNNTRDG